MEIRKATMQDFESVLELKLELKELAREFSKTLQPPSKVQEDYEKYLRNHLSGENSTVFAAFGGEKAVAMIVAKTYRLLPIYGDGKRGILSNLFVKEEFRNQGIAQELVKKATEWLKSKNAGAATIKVYSKNTAALELFRSLGFTDFSVKIFKEL